MEFRKVVRFMQNTNLTNTQTPRYATWLDPISTQPTHKPLDTLLGWTVYQTNQHTNSSIRYLVGLYTKPTNAQTLRYATLPSLDCKYITVVADDN